MKKNVLIGLFMLSFFSIVAILFLFKDHKINIGTIGYYSSNTSASSVDSYRIIDYVLNQLNNEGRDYMLYRYDLKDYEDINDLKVVLKNDDIDIIIGPNTTSELEKILDFLHDLPIPVFLVTVASDKVNNLDDNLFRITDSMTIQVNQLSQAIFQMYEDTPITVFYTEENINFSENYALEVERIYNEKNIDVHLVRVGKLNEVATQNLLKRPLDTSVALIVAGPGKAGIMTDLIGNSNSQAVFFHSSWSKSDETLEFMNNVDNRVYSLGFKTPNNEENSNTFIEKILVSENLSYSVFTFNGYEITYFMDYVIQESGTTKLKDVKSFIHHLDSYVGKFNDYTFDDTGDGGRGFSLLEIIDHQYETIIEVLKY